MAAPIHDIQFAKQCEEHAKILACRTAYSDAVELRRLMMSIVKGAPKLALTPDVVKTYESALAYVSLAALPFLPDADLLDIFSHRLAVALSLDGFNLYEKLRAKLVDIDDLEERDIFKQRIRTEIERSVDALTQSVQVGVESVDGTVSGWLRYFLKKMGGNVPDSLQLAGFFNNDPLVVRLQPEEKNRLEGLITLFNKLSLSSSDPVGQEDEFVGDDEDEVTIYGPGTEETFNKKTDPVFTKEGPQAREILQQIWLADAETPSPLEQEADEFAKQQGLTDIKSKEILSGPVTDKKITVAALRVLAPGKAMAEITGLWQPGATTPEAVAHAFRKLLVTDLKLPDVHAAGIVWRLLQKLDPSEQEKYADLVYYDMASGYFTWNEAYVPKVIEEVSA